MRTEEEAASGSDSEADWVAEASPPSPSSVDEDEGEEQADHEGEGEEFVFGRSAVLDDGRLFASIDSWRIGYNPAHFHAGNTNIIRSCKGSTSRQRRNIYTEI